MRRGLLSLRVAVLGGCVLAGCWTLKPGSDLPSQGLLEDVVLPDSTLDAGLSCIPACDLGTVCLGGVCFVPALDAGTDVSHDASTPVDGSIPLDVVQDVAQRVDTATVGDVAGAEDAGPPVILCLAAFTLPMGSSISVPLVGPPSTAQIYLRLTLASNGVTCDVLYLSATLNGVPFLPMTSLGTGNLGISNESGGTDAVLYGPRTEGPYTLTLTNPATPACGDVSFTSDSSVWIYP